MRNQAECIRIFIVSDVRIGREALVHVLSDYPAVEVAGSRPNDDGALAEIRSTQPDAVLVDWSAVRENGRAHQLSSPPLDVKVVVFGVREDEGEVAACAAAGVAAYIPRDASLETLVRRVRAAVRGELLCSPRMAAIMFRCMRTNAASHAAAESAPAAVLSPREAEITDLLGQGLSNKQIARELGIRVPTVKNHVHSILRRLQVRHRSEAAIAHRQRNGDGHSSPRRDGFPQI